MLTYDPCTVKQVENEGVSIKNDAGYAIEWRDICINVMGIPKEEFDVPPSEAEKSYAKFLEGNARFEDWFNLHIILIGCVYVSEMIVHVLILTDISRTSGLVQACVGALQRPGY